MMKKPIRHNQEGLASFIVVISLMLIISLIVLSFSRIVRNEQRQVLDRNLSARAFYAAESGVNTAVALIKQGNLVGDKTDCLGDPLKADDYAVDKNANTEVTCLTIDPDPETLKYTIAKGESRVIPLKGSAALGGLKFSWQDSNATASTNYGACTTTTSFPTDTSAAWKCNAPVLRVDLVDISTVDSASLVNNMTTFFLYPNKGLVQNGTGPGLSVDNTPVNRGGVAAAACRNDNTTLPKACNVTVTGPAASGQNYYVRITSLYSNADLVLSAVNPGIGFSGAQALIDSTGKAQDVLRRIQVRRSLNDDQGIPDYSLQVAAGLCKRYMVAPGTPTPVAIDPGVTNPNDIAGICALN